jgi:hypothetical protein
MPFVRAFGKSDHAILSTPTEADRQSPDPRLEVIMPTLQLIFIITVALTVTSGAAAGGIVIFGDTRRNLGQRAMAEKFAQIALLGAAAIVSLLAVA